MTAEAQTGYHPNMKDLPDNKDSLFCFKDPNRVCGADCMAYADQPEGQEYIGKPWSRCLILLNQHRMGKHLVILTNIVDRIEKRMIDARRANQTPPPRPNG